ncbi:MAG TPA: hypothetical protein ENJ71_04100 [Epsilonproteobacteria bacterium]|nr:hypothetical protein [Campylobacterota bacterium]
MEKDRSFAHLFSKKSSSHTPHPTSSARKVLFWGVFLFFLLYLKYRPYEQGAHIVSGSLEYIFTLYHFIINQTIGIVHEAGHGVCYLLPCPTFMMILNGTLFQWLFPFGIAWYYKRKHNMVGWWLGLFVLAISMDYTAWYISTAPSGAYVPALKSFLGVDGLHDFHYILDTLGLLAYSGVIAMVLKILSLLVMFRSIFGLFSIAYGKNKTRRVG